MDILAIIKCIFIITCEIFYVSLQQSLFKGCKVARYWLQNCPLLALTVTPYLLHMKLNFTTASHSVDSELIKMRDNIKQITF